MDPYLEAPSLWPDVHHRLITAMCDQIQAQLGPQYTAIIMPYVAFESIDIAPVRLAVPDIAIVDRDAPSTAAHSVVVAPPPLTGTAAMEVPTRYARIEIRTVDGETLVTAIELLSPVNKRPGVDGADAYERKRQELFRSEAHLLEIDLLRGGAVRSFSLRSPTRPTLSFLVGPSDARRSTSGRSRSVTRSRQCRCRCAGLSPMLCLTSGVQSTISIQAPAMSAGSTTGRPRHPLLCRPKIALGSTRISTSLAFDKRGRGSYGLGFSPTAKYRRNRCK
jgi:hypothetical protein